MLIQKYKLLTFSSILLLLACSEDTPIIPNEDELITTVIYTLHSTMGNDTYVFTFRDIDGEGGIPPEISTSTLPANSTFRATILLLNESENPAEDISAEVGEEADEHQFFFQITDANVMIAYDDNDSNGNPIGLDTDISTGAPSRGNLTITLRHLPDKFANGVAQGEIINAGGETDIEVSFPIIIE